MFESNRSRIPTRLLSGALRSISFLTLTFSLASCHRSSSYYTDRADKLYSAGKYADAALTYSKAIQANASSSQAYAVPGLTELKLNQLRENVPRLNTSRGSASGPRRCQGDPRRSNYERLLWG
jgi:hypothetical protein